MTMQYASMRTGRRPTIAALAACLLLLISSGCATRGVPESTTDQRSAVVAAAQDQQGAPYRSGAEGPDAFDASGLVYYAYRAAGAPVPRDSYAQLEAGKPVTFAQAKPGDLVFYQLENEAGQDHLRVGLYRGDSEMLYASAERGEVVLQAVDDDYWAQRLLGVIRILPESE